MSNKLPPLLHVGTFGTHVMDAPSGQFVFVGTVPEYFRDVGFPDRAQAVAAFFHWFVRERDNLPADCVPGPELAAMLAGVTARD